MAEITCVSSFDLSDCLEKILGPYRIVEYRVALFTRGNRTPGSRVATSCNSLVAHTKYHSHAQSIDRVSNGGQREDKKLLKRSQLCQHGEVWHVSVNDHGSVVRLFMGPL